jgi:hypothetical protein
MRETIPKAEKQISYCGGDGPNGYNSLVTQKIAKVSCGKLGYGVSEKEESRDEPHLGMGDVQIPHDERDNRRDVEPVKVEATIDKP